MLPRAPSAPKPPCQGVEGAAKMGLDNRQFAALERLEEAEPELNSCWNPQKKVPVGHSKG
jgi:hypothetical protein